MVKEPFFMVNLWGNMVGETALKPEIFDQKGLKMLAHDVQIEQKQGIEF